MAQARSKSEQSEKLKFSVGYAAASCMEIALQNLGMDNSYTGNATVALDGYTCAIRPIYKQNNQWIVETQAQEGMHTFRQRSRLSSLDPLNVVSWIEVPQF
jgi:hypothetical protein